MGAIVSKSIFDFFEAALCFFVVAVLQVSSTVPTPRVLVVGASQTSVIQGRGKYGDEALEHPLGTPRPW